MPSHPEPNGTTRSGEADTHLPAHGPDTDGDRAAVLDGPTRALGRRIVGELGGENASLLSRWVAYRIAELMRDAEDSSSDSDDRRKAVTACTELILRVWQHRTHWPQGWPPPDAADILDALKLRSRWQRAALPDDPAEVSWTTTLPAIIDSLEYDQTLWTLAALAEQDPGQLRSWLDQDGAAIATDERETLMAIHAIADDAPARLRALLFDESHPKSRRVLKGDPASRAKDVEQALQRSSTSRIKVAQHITKTARDARRESS